MDADFLCIRPPDPAVFTVVVTPLAVVIPAGACSQSRSASPMEKVASPSRTIDHDAVSGIARKG